MPVGHCRAGAASLSRSPELLFVRVVGPERAERQVEPATRRWRRGATSRPPAPETTTNDIATHDSTTRNGSPPRRDSRTTSMPRTKHHHHEADKPDITPERAHDSAAYPRIRV